MGITLGAGPPGWTYIFAVPAVIGLFCVFFGTMGYNGKRRR